MWAASVFLCLFGTADQCLERFEMHDQRGPYATIEECQERTAQMHIQALMIAHAQGICRPRIWAECREIEVDEVL